MAQQKTWKIRSNWLHFLRGVGWAILYVLLGSTESWAQQEGGRQPDAQRGYDILRTQAFLPADFDDAVFEQLWTTWPEPQRSTAEKATAEERRRLTFDYYGLTPSPDDQHRQQPALGYVSNGQGGWVMNCLTCHGGQLNGTPYPGLPNFRFALQTLTEDVRTVKQLQRKPYAHLDLASFNLPLSQTNGITNSVIFGVVLGTYRRPDMSVDLRRTLPELVHHDMDAPPFWNVRKKVSLYVDGFAPKTHRPLMQFMMIPSNKQDKLYGWEEDFRDIQAWIESVPVPKYPGPIDQQLVDVGHAVFGQHCSRCHGTYGPDSRYEQKIIPIQEVGTDPVRLQALTPEHRRWMQAGWMSRYGEDPVILDPPGYVAPPLDGIWASAPYFHNGSVPTLWHLLHPQERPVVWKRISDELETEKVGLQIESFGSVPDEISTPREQRQFYDTTRQGNSAAGHDFPELLTEEERRALLEYLKSL